MPQLHSTSCDYLIFPVTLTEMTVFSPLNCLDTFIKNQMTVNQFSRSVVSDSLWPHGLQHTRLPCPSPNPWSLLKLMSIKLVIQPTHSTISSSVIPFSCLQSFPASVSFPMSQFFTSGGQNIGVSASASVPAMNIQGWFPLGLTDSFKMTVNVMAHFQTLSSIPLIFMSILVPVSHCLDYYSFV